MNKDKNKEGVLGAKTLLVETRLVHLDVKVRLNILHNTREIRGFLCVRVSVHVWNNIHVAKPVRL